MSRWHVIGAHSFTGKHFVRMLKDRGEEVVTEGGLRALYWLGNVTPEDYVVNFAAVNVVAPSWEYPGHYMKVNVGRVTEAADGMVRNPPRRYLHVSTPEVYGSTFGWINEKAPYNPSTPYAVSRAAAEMMLKCYYKQHGLPVIFTRACNVYGPEQQLYRLLPKLICTIKHKRKFKLEGGGLSARAFLHVADVCEATYIAATRGEPGQAYHIAGIDFQPISAIVNLVCRMMHVDPEEVIERAPERPGKDAAYQLRATKIEQLGWAQQIPLMHGITEVIGWIEEEWEVLQHRSMEYQFKP